MGVGMGADDENVQFNLNIQVNDTQGNQNGQGQGNVNQDAPSNVSMNMQVDGVNMGIQMNVDEMQSGSNVQQNTTVTGSTQVQTSHTTSSSVTTNTRPQEVTYTGRCASSMDQASLNTAKNSINSKSFEDSKLTLAKQVAKSNCMTAAQIKEVMGLFSFEETKLEFAKYAYDFCFNQGNYYDNHRAAILSAATAGAATATESPAPPGRSSRGSFATQRSPPWRPSPARSPGGTGRSLPPSDRKSTRLNSSHSSVSRMPSSA